jgi:molecular chaperone Hsp33
MSELHRFLFEGLAVRGILVRLDDGWQSLLARRASAGAAWPEPVQRLAGEMAAAGVLMHATIKWNGALILQVYGDGPVRLAVAEVGADLTYRVTAKVEAPVADDAGLEAMLNVHGKGRCAVTLDTPDRQPGQQPYQGVVPLHDDEGRPLQAIGSVLEHYMLQSEQLDTRLVLAADGRVAAGLLIQRLPPARGAREDDIGRDEGYNRISHLVATLGRDELLALDAEALLHRLFWQEPLRRFEPVAGLQAPRFACTCSAAKVASMLRALGRAEAEDIVAEQGAVTVSCEFCAATYRFDAVDVAELDIPVEAQAPGTPTIN